MKFLFIIFYYILYISATEIDSLFPADLSYLENRQLSSECSAQLANLDAATLWTMFDASTKLPSGLTAGTVFDLGNFDECYNIESVTATTGTVYGKYCLGTIQFPTTQLQKLYVESNYSNAQLVNIHPLQERMLGTQTSPGYHFSICVPDKCSAKEISFLSTFEEDYCYVKKEAPELSVGAVITLVFFGIVIGLVMISTLIDICYYYLDNPPPHELWLSFSILSNGRKLIKATKNQDQLLCLNGIKAISMMWVIIGHEYNLAMFAPVTNLNDIMEVQNDAGNMWLLSATVSVDTFFLVGGLVTVYTFLRASDKGVKFNVILYYVHRILRLSPAFGAAILIYSNLLRYISNGPLWNEVDVLFGKACVERWYASFFYVNNFVGPSEARCMGQAWYLTIDMQLYLLSPLVLIPLTKWVKPTLWFLFALIVLGVIVPFVIGYEYEINAFLSGDSKTFGTYYYIQTHCRFAPYVIGMVFGYFLYKYKKTNKGLDVHPHLAGGLWLIAITGMVACLWAHYDAQLQPYDKITHSLFLAFQRPAWSVAVGMVIYLCVVGYGGPVDKFLSLPIFQFLTKLSYSMYLLHPIIQIVRCFSMKTTFYYSHFNVMTAFWGDFVLTMVASAVLCLTFESPIIVFEKYIFGRGKPMPTKKLHV